MVTRNVAFNNAGVPCRQSRISWIKPVLLEAALAVYAITGAISTARAQGGGQCIMESARREALAAQGSFKALRLADRPSIIRARADISGQPGQGC